MPTTYQIFNSSTPIATNLEYLDGSVYEVIVYHYTQSKIIHQDTIDKVVSGGGKTGLIEVPAKTEILKVSFKMLPPQSPYYNSPGNKRLYLIDYKIVTREVNNIIGINGSSYVTDTITKSNAPVDFLKTEQNRINAICRSQNIVCRQ